MGVNHMTDWTEEEVENIMKLKTGTSKFTENKAPKSLGD
jgi:hypothetical protein